MRITVSDVAPSRSRGFSLIEAAVAVALLSIATAFSLPRLHRLANMPVAEQNAPHNVVPAAAPPPSAGKVKLINLIHGRPANSTGRVFIDWGDFGSRTELNSPALANSDAPSGEKAPTSVSTQRSGKSATAGANFGTNRQ